MGRASEKFNEQSFRIKLLELPPLPRIDGSFFPTNAAIDSYPASLRERLEGIDRICRGIWQIQGKAVTPEFVREVLVPKVITQIDAVVGESVSRSSATDLERWGPAWAYLAGEVGELRSEFANRYEIEARELEYRNAPTESYPAQRQAPVSQPFDQRENLRDAILKKKSRIAESERILNRAPLTEHPQHRGRPVHGGENSRLRLEEERQHLLIAVQELEAEAQRSTVSHAQNRANLAEGAESKPTDRRMLVENYIQEVLAKTGKRITRKMIWTKAGYKTRTEFERWERQDPNHPNKAANRTFTRLLSDEKPHLK